MDRKPSTAARTGASRTWSRIAWAVAGLTLGAALAFVLSRRQPPPMLRVSPVGVPGPAPAKETYDQLMERATRLLDQNTPEKALPLYEKVLGDRPGDVEALFGRGLARAKLGDRPGAARDLQAAIDKEPGFADAIWALADLRRVEGDKEAARAGFQRYLELDPQGRYADSARRHLAEL